jgi:hypothetical protein
MARAGDDDRPEDYLVDDATLTRSAAQLFDIRTSTSTHSLCFTKKYGLVFVHAALTTQ